MEGPRVPGMSGPVAETRGAGVVGQVLCVSVELMPKCSFTSRVRHCNIVTCDI